MSKSRILWVVVPALVIAALVGGGLYFEGSNTKGVERPVAPVSGTVTESDAGSITLQSRTSMPDFGIGHGDEIRIDMGRVDARPPTATEVLLDVTRGSDGTFDLATPESFRVGPTLDPVPSVAPVADGGAVFSIQQHRRRGPCRDFEPPPNNPPEPPACGRPISGTFPPGDPNAPASPPQ